MTIHISKSNRSALRLVCASLLCSGILSLSACGGDAAGEVALDPLHLISSIDEDESRHHPTKYSEVEMGSFYVTLPIEGTIDIYRVTFTAFAVVSKGEEGAVAKLIESRSAIVRDGVISVVQRIDEEKLHDPELVWLKTELVQVLRRSLHTTDIYDVIFPEFTIERG